MFPMTSNTSICMVLTATTSKDYNAKGIEGKAAFLTEEIDNIKQIYMQVQEGIESPYP